MIYNEKDITCYACMNGTAYVIGHPDIMTEIMHVDGSFDLLIRLTPENIDCLLACAKEAGLV